ncbi:hypothetical protein [Metabacillus sp. SLBN-84]
MKNIVIIMDGGIIQNILTEDETIEITVVDYDTEGADSDEITSINGNDACVLGPTTEVNPEEIKSILQTIKGGADEGEYLDDKDL